MARCLILENDETSIRDDICGTYALQTLIGMTRMGRGERSIWPWRATIQRPGHSDVVQPRIWPDPDQSPGNGLRHSQRLLQTANQFVLSPVEPVAMSHCHI